MKFLHLYPIVLALIAIGGFAVCEWFHAHDLPSRRQHDDLSLKYYLTSGPQLAAALLLLYYAITFTRRGSEFAHQLLVESCLHQSLTSLLVGAVLHSGFHMTHSACCAYPVFCPVDVTACELHAIFQCPKRLESFAHYDLGFRSAQFLATCVLLAAMASVAPVHRLRHLMSRFRRAEFLTFDRRRPAALVTPPSLQPSSNV